MESINEIISYLTPEDYSLARRRLLDAAFETSDVLLIKEAIAWSRKLRSTDVHVDTHWKTEAIALTEKISQIGPQNKHHGEEQYLLKANAISKTYSRGNFKLHPMDIQIGFGDIWGIVGENGNGKTTLLRCMAGQLKIDAGTISYYFMPDGKKDFYTIKEHVAFIPQRIPKWFGQLKDNLHFAATIAGKFDEENALLVDFMLERLDLAEYAHLTWDQISSGYRTRFEIARVLIQRPKLLILDEPLANLDINAQQILLNDLKNIASSKRHPMGILLSSQQLHEVEKIATKVVFIKKGNYIFSTGEQPEKLSHTIELETDVKKADLEKVLLAHDPQVLIKFNGGVYIIESMQMAPEKMLTLLIEARIKVNYYRDITHSTKKYFNL